MRLFCKDRWIQISEIRKVAISVHRAWFKWQRVGSYSYMPLVVCCHISLYRSGFHKILQSVSRDSQAGPMVWFLFLRLCKYVAELGKGPWSCTLQPSNPLLTALVYWQTWSLTTQALRTEAQSGATNTDFSWRSQISLHHRRRSCSENSQSTEVQRQHLSTAAQKSRIVLVCAMKFRWCASSLQPLCVCAHIALVHLMTEGKVAWNYVL